MDNLEIFEEEDKGISMDLIIEKFIPIIGAILLIVGFGYLIYTSVWSVLDVTIRLAIGFLASFAIIYAGNKLTDKLKYFSDVIIGAGVLLLYGTLIYGSRSELGQAATIPEIGSLIVSFVFTAIIAFFAVARKSSVILILSLLGAYLTPFVIGQQGSWAQNMSFNSFLIYFTSINVVLFQLGKDFSLKSIIPLNIAGLFFGTTSLYALSYKGSELVSTGFFASNTFSVILILILALFSIWSIIITSLEYSEKEDSYISFGYVLTLFWLILNVSILGITGIFGSFIYLIFAISAFIGWYYLKSNSNSKLQHVSLYSIGIFSLIMTFTIAIPDLDKYSSLFIVYTSLIFGGLYLLDNSKTERLYAYFGFSFVGALLALNPSILNSVNYETLYIVLALFPASLSYFITKKSDNEDTKSLSLFYSIFASGLISIILFIDLFSYLIDFLELINIVFVFFYVIPLFVVYYLNINNNMTDNSKTTALRFSMIWFVVGYFTAFFLLLSKTYPAPLDTHFFGSPGLFSDWLFIYGIFASVISYFGLKLSRKLKSTDSDNHPTHLLVILFYSSVFVIGNYIIYAFINDLGFSGESGGVRAISATLFWVILAIYMLISGMRGGDDYKTEKFLGLSLLFFTVGKIILYDMATMAMTNKIIVLMIAGGLLLSFSYFTHKNKKDIDSTIPKKKINKVKDVVKKEIKEEVKSEKNENQLENTDGKILNRTIKNIDVSDIESTRFILNNGKTYKIKTKNLFKIVTLIVNDYGKTKFEAGELKVTFDNIVKNYSSKLSKNDYERLLGLMKEFVDDGGKVEIVRK